MSIIDGYDMMKNKGNEKMAFLMFSSCLIITILISGCTTLNAGDIENTPVATATLTTETPGVTPQSTQSESTKPSVSWKDYYPEHNEQTKQKCIEEAKDEILRLFPDVDRTTLNGNWIEHSRINDNNNMEEIGRPHINFENVEYTSGESRSFAIEVDPELMRVVYYSPYSGQYNPAVISYREAKAKAIDFIKKAQGEDSIVDDPDAYMIDKNSYLISGRPIVQVEYWKKEGGVIYPRNYVYVEYDMSRDRVERYFDYLPIPELLSGLTTLSPEPDITLDEAIQMFEDKLAERYELDDLAIEYSEIEPDYLIWLDSDKIVYADDPNPIPLVWSIGCSNEESRQEFLETGVRPICGSIQIDAHTGEIYSLIYDQKIIIESKYDYYM